MAISIASRKAKGRKLQQWAAEKISKLIDIPWGKDCLISSREMGQSGVDVRLIGEAREKFPFSVEAKSAETWMIHQWIDQAKANVLPDTDWMLIAKRSQKKGVEGRTVVIMDAEKFFDLLEKFKKESNNG